MVCYIFISSSSSGFRMMRFLLLLIVVINIIEVSSSFPIGLLASSSSSSSSSSSTILQLLPSRRRATATATTTTLIGNKPCKRSFLITTTTTTLRGGSNGNDGDESNTTIDNDNNEDSNKKLLLKDYSNEASALFGNIRIPAALFSGASAGAAFAMPISSATEGLKIGLVKRLYSFLMIGALSSEILAVVVSTLAVASLSMKSYPPKVPTKTLSDFIYKNNYELSWVTTRFHFLSGVLCFVIALGIRAWIVIVCPVFAKASLLLISSATLLCMAFIQDMGIIVKNNNDDNNKLGNILNLPVGYLKLFVSKAKKNPYFAIALGLYLTTFGYVTYMIPHIWTYLKM